MRDSDFEEIACHFFNQFLELKIQLDSGAVTKPPDYDKELRQWRKATDQFKAAAQGLAEDVERITAEVADREEEIGKLRLQLNETLISLGLAQKKLEGLGIVKAEARKTGYSFVEHMSEESRRAWESLMKEVPYSGPREQ